MKTRTKKEANVGDLAVGSWFHFVHGDSETPYIVVEVAVPIVFKGCAVMSTRTHVVQFVSDKMTVNPTQ